MLRKLTVGLIFSPFLMAGSCLKPEPAIDKPLFCDVVSLRKFTQAEIDWRAAYAPWNLKKDYAQNLTFERECTSGGD